MELSSIVAYAEVSDLVNLLMRILHVSVLICIVLKIFSQ